MNKHWKTIRPILWVSALVLFPWLIPGTLRAQEIRPLAEPNQSIRMGRGGYLCEGHLTHTPIDATGDWTYEMVQCTGPIFSSSCMQLSTRSSITMSW